MSPYRIVRSPLAESDLIEIWAYIAVDSPSAADGVVRAITSKIDRLSDFPRIGSERAWISPGLRGLSSPPYVIFYRVSDEDRIVSILGVLHMARDIEALFR